MHEGQIEKRVQYTVEKLFRVRKNRFRDHVGVEKALDLVEEADKITHNVALDDSDLDIEDSANQF